jgi:uncharacterized phage-associated protein
VANFFLQAAGDENDVTNMKLNKLLYFAQGHSLAVLGRPLFDEDIEAWEYGPVIPAVYRKYRVCGRTPIVAEDGYAYKFTSEEKVLLSNVWVEYGKYSAGFLVSLTHSNRSPWHEAIYSGSKVITRSRMEECFKSLKLPTIHDALSGMDIPKGWISDEDDDEDDEVWAQLYGSHVSSQSRSL